MKTIIHNINIYSLKCLKKEFIISSFPQVIKNLYIEDFQQILIIFCILGNADSSTSPSRLTEQNSDNSSSPDSVHSRSATYPTGSSFQMTNLANSSPSTTTLPFAQPYLAEMCNYGPIYHHHHLHGHHPSYGSYLPFQG